MNQLRADMINDCLEATKLHAGFALANMQPSKVPTLDSAIAEAEEARRALAIAIAEMKRARETRLRRENGRLMTVPQMEAALAKMRQVMMDHGVTPPAQ